MDQMRHQDGRTFTGAFSILAACVKANRLGTSRRALDQLDAHTQGTYEMAACEGPGRTGWRYALLREVVCVGIRPTTIESDER